MGTFITLAKGDTELENPYVKRLLPPLHENCIGVLVKV
jgi:hypothetical protein